MNQFQNLALTALVASPTNPRKTFDPVKLKELATSIAASGVHQAILVRQLPAQRLLDTAHIKPRPEYEIVAGERRYRASVIAKADTIPAIIRELSDEQVLEIQIIENLQRDDLSALEAAEGYQTLMDHSHLSADQVAEKIGKSRTFVYNSLKLLKLSPTAKLAMREQGLTASVAELIARIPNDALQAKALAFAVAPDGDGDKPSYRTFSQWAQRNVMLNLQHASFPIDTVMAPFAKAGACTTCSKRTGANPDLFTDVKSADMCTDPPCYHAKNAVQEGLNKREYEGQKGDGNDGQQGLGLVSTLAQDARAQQAKGNSTERDIEAIKAGQALAIHKAQRTACFDYSIEFIYDHTDDIEAKTLLPVELLRRWLQRQVSDWESDDLAVALDMPPCGDTDADEYESNCRLRIGRASDADIYRYMAAMLLLPDRDTYASHIDRVKEPLLLNAFASELAIDLDLVRNEAADQVETEMKAKIAALNQQIKAAKPAKAPKSAPAETTSTHTPAGAANGSPAADAKKPASRKSKTSAEEAKAGIAAAMQSIEAEPLDASLGGSALAVGVRVKVLDGKHVYREGVIRDAAKNDMWAVTFGGGANMFTANLATKSLQVMA